MEEENLEEKKKILASKISSFSKDNFSIALAGIILFSFIVRIYFFLGSKQQAHWWDSLAFGSIAKNMIYGLWSDSAFIAHETIIRPPLLTILWSLFIKLNISEAFTIFILEIIPSTLSILFIYLIAKELFDKKTALISASILAVSWIHLFYTMRIMSDIPSLFFSLVSIYFFIKSHENFHLKYFSLAILFISLSLLTRYFYGIIGAIYILFVITTHKRKLLENKNFWFGGIIGTIPLLIFFGINLVKYGGILPAASVYTESASTKSIGYYVLNFLPYILGELLLVFFIIGLALIIFELIVGFDKITSSKKLRLNVFLLSIFIFPMIFFTFILRAAEDRYWFLAFPAIIILTSFSISVLYNKAKKYSKYFAFLLVLLVLIFSAYSQLTFAKGLIDNKKATYSQMKDAFLWIKENTFSEAVLLGDGIEPYAIYYGERKVAIHNDTNIAEMTLMADYIILHRFEHQGQQLLEYVNNKTGSEYIPVKAIYFDAEQTNPAVIIYKIEKN